MNCQRFKELNILSSNKENIPPEDYQELGRNIDNDINRKKKRIPLRTISDSTLNIKIIR